MVPFEKLDAFKICHELTIAVYKTIEEFEERDPGLAGELALAALIASSRIARGTGFRNRRSETLARRRGAPAPIVGRIVTAVKGEALIGR